MTPWLSW